MIKVGGKPRCSQDDTRALADHRRGRQRCGISGVCETYKKRQPVLKLTAQGSKFEHMELNKSFYGYGYLLVA